MRVLGLTGGISCGKSTVVKVIERSGVPVIDCDKIARQIVQPGSSGLKAIVKEFGKDVLQADGSLDRKGLGKIIFNDKEQRRKLNKITIPRITQTIIWSLFSHFIVGTPLVVIDAPTLYETKSLLPVCHSVIVVATTEEKQLEWLMARDKSGEKDAQARITAQMPLSSKVEMAEKVFFAAKSLSLSSLNIDRKNGENIGAKETSHRIIAPSSSSSFSSCA